MSEYIFEDVEANVSDQEVGKEVEEIKKQKDKEKSAVNPAEVKKIMQGAKKIGIPVGAQNP